MEGSNADLEYHPAASFLICAFMRSTFHRTTASIRSSLPAVCGLSLSPLPMKRKRSDSERWASNFALGQTSEGCGRMWGSTSEFGHFRHSLIPRFIPRPTNLFSNRWSGRLKEAWNLRRRDETGGWHSKEHEGASGRTGASRHLREADKHSGFPMPGGCSTVEWALEWLKEHREFRQADWTKPRRAISWRHTRATRPMCYGERSGPFLRAGSDRDEAGQDGPGRLSHET